jgi:hypothetical protein
MLDVASIGELEPRFLFSSFWLEYGLSSSVGFRAPFQFAFLARHGTVGWVTFRFWETYILHYILIVADGGYHRGDYKTNTYTYSEIMLTSYLLSVLFRTVKSHDIRALQSSRSKGPICTTTYRQLSLSATTYSQARQSSTITPSPHNPPPLACTPKMIPFTPGQTPSLPPSFLTLFNSLLSRTNLR